MSEIRKFAIFDLDLTLTVKHLWIELGYHGRGKENLDAMSREVWVREQGGPGVFFPDKLLGLFGQLREEGYELGIATFNLEHVALAFLKTFGLLEFIQRELLIARDTPESGSKAQDWALILKRVGLTPESEWEAQYYDDSSGECEDVKQRFPRIKVHHILSPLSSIEPEVEIL